MFCGIDQTMKGETNFLFYVFHKESFANVTTCVCIVETAPNGAIKVN